MKRLAVLMLAASIISFIGCSAQQPPQVQQENEPPAEEEVFGDDFEAGSTDEWKADQAATKNDPDAGADADTDSGPDSPPEQ